MFSLHYLCGDFLGIKIFHKDINDSESEILFLRYLFFELLASFFLMLVSFFKTDFSFVADPILQQSFRRNAVYSFFYGLALWGVVIWSLKFLILYLSFKHIISEGEEISTEFIKGLISARKIPIYGKIALIPTLILVSSSPGFYPIFLRAPFIFMILMQYQSTLGFYVLGSLSFCEIIGYLLIPKNFGKPLYLSLSWVFIVAFLAVFLPV